MDPNDLEKIIDPVASGDADYSKGNRLFYGDAWNMIPRLRYMGNSFLSLMTKIASGYWHIADSQSGYTAISLTVLKRITLNEIYKGYGMPNDLLIKLNQFDFKVRDVHIKPVYNRQKSEESRVKTGRIHPGRFLKANRRCNPKPLRPNRGKPALGLIAKSAKRPLRLKSPLK